ncbi:MAG: toll/interleukin-1 receptor domain-containing protein, partial [Gammaproteobacteria bacterium]|nr:toll/interleukin-1 receptor domain-containing protein [Gammaproteobacteria bacterium]
MSDVFISYAREDGDFVHRLNAALKTRKRITSIDVQDLLPAEQWPARVEDLIAEADCFVFVISPHSAASIPCRDELGYALAFNKRVIPVLRVDTETDTLPTPLGTLNWLFMREADDFQSGLAMLDRVLDTEPEYVHVHTRLTIRAREWERADHDRSALIRGGTLQSAQTWLAGATGKS